MAIVEAETQGTGSDAEGEARVASEVEADAGVTAEAEYVAKTDAEVGSEEAGV